MTDNPDNLSAKLKKHARIVKSPEIIVKTNLNNKHGLIDLPEFFFLEGQFLANGLRSGVGRSGNKNRPRTKNNQGANLNPDGIVQMFLQGNESIPIRPKVVFISSQRKLADGFAFITYIPKALPLG